MKHALIFCILLSSLFLNAQLPPEEAHETHTTVTGYVVAIEDTPDANGARTFTIQFESIHGFEITDITVGPRNWSAFFETRLIDTDDMVTVDLINAKLTGVGPGTGQCSGHLWSVEEIIRPMRTYESPSHRSQRIRSWEACQQQKSK